MALAIQVQEDEHYSNRFYSSVAGVRLEEFNLLEVDVLKLLDYKMLVHSREYNECRRILLLCSRTLPLPAGPGLERGRRSSA